ncbi:MAG: hypothetical protein ABJL55_17575 [Roseibium sp.]
MRGWKTLVLNSVAGVTILVLEVLSFMTSTDWHLILSPERASLLVLGLGLANILLRHITSGPTGWRKDQTR